MSVDLLATVRLLHRVLGFLVEQSSADLLDIAEGRKALHLAESGPTPDFAGPQKGSPPKISVPGKAKRGTSAAKETGEARDPGYSAMAETLRGFGSDTEGADYLDSLRIDDRKARKADLIRIGACMGLQLSERSTLPDLQRKLIGHAIGARKKYAGLNRL